MLLGKGVLVRRAGTGLYAGHWQAVDYRPEIELDFVYKFQVL